MITTTEKAEAKIKDIKALEMAKEKDRKRKLVPFLVCKSPRTEVLIPKGSTIDYKQKILERHLKDGRIRINEV